ncbi:MAG: non-heme iron oxygenase ferredoxin subunit [Gemmatimonadota bacterium]|nr:MAG: non-heme iron oxygenase ferredoxin subunit [Gemmatimonadota bacterium]
MTEPGFERVASLGDLPESTPVAVELSTGEGLCLVRVRDEVFAFADRCSHADFPLSDGEMVDDHAIECPLHGAQFDVRTGEAIVAPGSENLALYEVTLQGTDVLVRGGGE